MKRVLLAILAVLVSTSVYADAGSRDRGRDNHRNDNHQRDRYDNRHDGRHDNHHRPPVFRPPVFRPPVVVVPPIYQPPYYPPQPQYGVQFVVCGSVGYRPNFCFTGLRFITRLDVMRQLSNAPCIPGQSYSVRGNQILVTNGCEAQFRVEGNY